MYSKNVGYCNARIYYYDDGDKELESYSTLVLLYNAETDSLYCTGLYSATTRRHIGRALKILGFPLIYQDIKKLVELNTDTGTDGYSLGEWCIRGISENKSYYYNRNTGEIKDILRC